MSVEHLHSGETAGLGFFYVPGLIVAIIAFRKVGSSFAWLMALRILCWLGSFGVFVYGCIFFTRLVIYPDSGHAIMTLVFLLIFPCFLWAGGLLQQDEKYAARLGFAYALIDIPVFGLMSLFWGDHGFYGGFLSFFSALAFGLGCLRWLKQPRRPIEAMQPPPTAIVVPK